MYQKKPYERVTPLCSSLALAAGLALPLTANAQSEADESMQLEEVVVSTTRTETSASELTRSVTVVSGAEVREQTQHDRNLSSVLAKKVPGLSPSTEAVSNYGQSLRGRNFLVLIDGVPQSTPLRDGARDLNTIDPAVIERIEVVRGGTAIYGFGATGGLINIITKEPSTEAVAGYSQAGVRRSTTHNSDSGEYETTHRVSGTQSDWDYLASGTFVQRNGQFDSEGRRLPPNPKGSQGGFSDSEQFDVLGKLGHDFDDGRQRIDFSFNRFEVEQDTDYTFGAEGFTLNEDPTPNSRRTPAIRKSEAITDQDDVVDAGTENTLAQTNYTHRDVLGGSLKLNTYYGDQSVVYPRFPGFPQSEIQSEKLGSRLTMDTPLTREDRGTRVSWGADILRDETKSEYFGSNASDISPEMEQDATAVFAQLHVPIGNSGVIRGGLRHEEISVDVSRVESNQYGNTVRAGTLEYSETLPNISGALYLTDTSELFASYSQGFSIADVGRVITDGGSFTGGETLDAEDFETKAETVDNYEIGIRGGSRLRYTLAAFYSESDNGTTFDEDLRIQKFSEAIHGVEGSLDYDLTRSWLVGGTASWAEGERESDAGTVDLDNTRISPPKVTAHAEYSPMSLWDARLQVLRVGDRDPDTSEESGFPHGEVEGYTLVDLSARINVGPGDLRLSVANLFNEDYYPAVNQAYDSNYAYTKGQGRTVGASYEVNW
ncbi:MAG: TonB-dependent receptor [Halofilum sp. (in: g-proteobacteria)]